VESKWPKNLLLILSNCTDPAREEEFNDWYSHTHLPDLAKAHGLVNAARYRNVRPKEGGAKYLAVYELDTDDTKKLVREIMEGDVERTKQGRMIDCIKLYFGGTFERIEP
jgi:hypothetical protein